MPESLSINAAFEAKPNTDFKPVPKSHSISSLPKCKRLSLGVTTHCNTATEARGVACRVDHEQCFRQRRELNTMFDGKETFSISSLFDGKHRDIDLANWRQEIRFWS